MKNYKILKSIELCLIYKCLTRIIQYVLKYNAIVTNIIKLYIEIVNATGSKRKKDCYKQRLRFRNKKHRFNVNHIRMYKFINLMCDTRALMYSDEKIKIKDALPNIYTFYPVTIKIDIIYKKIAYI